jgi:hypothetical protein
MRKISLTQGKTALVSDEDYERVSQRKWIARVTWQGHWYAYESGNPWLSMHEFIAKPGSGKIVLHLNDDGLDNRRENLKVGTNSDNQHLRWREAKGYHWESSRKKWKAMISIDYKPIFLGRFDREEDAAQAYQEAKQKVLAKIFGVQKDDEDDE